MVTRSNTVCKSPRPILFTRERVERTGKMASHREAVRDSGADYDILTAIHLDDLERIKEVVKQSPARSR